MYSMKQIKIAKAGYVVLSAVLGALGILLVAMPDFFAPFLVRICGISLILFGMVKLVGYFSKDLFQLAFQYDLALGVLLLILGGALVVRPGRIVNFVSIVLGVYILIDGLLKVQIALDAKRFGIRQWLLILLAALLTGTAGFLLILRPMESARFLIMLAGIALLAEGILNLITALAVVRIIRRKIPENIDVEYRELEKIPYK